MDDILNNIKAALIDLQTSISSANAEGITKALSAVSELTEKHGADLDRQLHHYLTNRSYLKALAHLGGETDIPVGVCGGKA